MSFCAMTTADRRELEAYRELGPVEELKDRLRNPYPAANAGYSPLPAADDDDFSLGGGLLDDEGPIYELDRSTIADDQTRWTK